MNSSHITSIRRRVRLVTLLNAAESAGLAPIKLQWLHAFAYLSNVLAPVWDLPVLDHTVLKRLGGPFYPELQRDLDCLVGTGIAKVSGIGYVRDLSNRWRLDGSYRLNRRFADPILAALDEFETERLQNIFVLELGYALAALSDEDIDNAVSEDATYSNPLVALDNVIEFESNGAENYTVNVALSFDSVISGVSASPGEKLHLYLRHLHRRIHGAQ